MNDDMNDTTIATSKRKSHILIWAKKLGGCLTKCHPRRKKKASYLDTGEPIPPSYRTNVANHMPRHTLSIRRSRSTTGKTGTMNSKTNSTGTNWALPSQGKLQPTTRHNLRREKTIRLVNASVSSLVGGRPSPRSTVSPRRSPGEEPLPGPRSVLSWLDSFQTQQVFHRDSPRSPTLRNDSAADLTARPGQRRPNRTSDLYSPTSPSMSSTASPHGKMSTGAQICYPPSIHSHVALNTMLTESVKGWEQDWDKPLHNRVGSSKGLWRTASQRLLIKNKDSIRRLNAEKAKKNKSVDITAVENRPIPQMRSIESIQEMVEEERRADEEWSGTWKAFDRAYGRAGTMVAG
ncbi:hypothetical protein COCMIDRAFT_33063 [Bipolaris oryzae ATCC 44560]|uniref:Uncharacterized protein n=1 Tax=Bipolaris oryzae ATCC 44560 TaxID=930090 RepID=W6ZQ57_COCMI|nr:uncharacterized protein COCMIDRAFT_33063 [Bipolaris oryzae ATCC 44560]EUC49639.1 hypothetical protein COCMIDRAFT_33063 [Bipolaris oryzae ATCC 44560]